MASERTWMPMYWRDYGGDTGHLNVSEHGAYLLLIKHYWLTGKPLKDDDNLLWRITCCESKREWMRLRPAIVQFFTINAGVLSHKRIDAELEKAARISAERRRVGVLGGRPRSVPRLVR